MENLLRGSHLASLIVFKLWFSINQSKSQTVTHLWYSLLVCSWPLLFVLYNTDVDLLKSNMASKITVTPMIPAAFKLYTGRRGHAGQCICCVYRSVSRLDEIKQAENELRRNKMYLDHYRTASKIILQCYQKLLFSAAATRYCPPFSAIRRTENSAPGIYHVPAGLLHIVASGTTSL